MVSFSANGNVGGGRGGGGGGGGGGLGILKERTKGTKVVHNSMEWTQNSCMAAVKETIM